MRLNAEFLTERICRRNSTGYYSENDRWRDKEGSQAADNDFPTDFIRSHLNLDFNNSLSIDREVLSRLMPKFVAWPFSAVRDWHVRLYSPKAKTSQGCQRRRKAYVDVSLGQCRCTKRTPDTTRRPPANEVIYHSSYKR
jgi:hypothetical protein